MGCAGLAAARGQDPSGGELRAVCRELLGRHASTRERLPYLERFYPAIWEAIGDRPTGILDLGCGLAPLALPWMEIPTSTSYHAVDADRAAIALVDAFLAHLVDRFELSLAWAIEVDRNVDRARGGMDEEEYFERRLSHLDRLVDRELALTKLARVENRSGSREWALRLAS